MYRFKFLLITSVMFAAMLNSTAGIALLQFPGEFDEMPGGGERPAQPVVQSQIEQLRELISQQKNKVTLLEQKAKILEAELKKCRGE